jgi:rod shape-determining protein MreD
VNVTPGTIVRIALLVLATVVLQLAVVTQITFFDADADMFPLVALSVGLLAGPIPGATCGFLLGLVADMALLQTLGVTSLLLIGVGYTAGRYRELRDASHKLVPVAGAAIATLAYATSFSLVQFLLGVESPVSPLVIRELLVGALINAAVAMPVFAGVRRLLRADLIDDLRPRRRRQGTTRRGPLTGAPLTSSAVTITGPATRPRGKS